MTKARVLAPWVDSVPPATARHSSKDFVMQRGTVPPAEQLSLPRELARGLLAWPRLWLVLIHCRREQKLCRACLSIKQLEMMLMSKLPKQPID